jgi:hypothetical protein
LNTKSYSTLSPAGRFKVVVLIRNTAEEAWLCGKDLLSGLERAYHELELADISGQSWWKSEHCAQE